MQFSNRKNVVLGALLLLAGSASANTVYDAVSGFSGTNNPNAPWSYLVAGAALSTQQSGTCTGGGISGWWNGVGQPNDATILKNVAAGTVTCSNTVVIPTDHLNLDPESLANVDVRFTAPSSGLYSIAGNFLGDDTNELSHPVQILLNGTQIFSGTIAVFQQTDAFNLSETLNAGDTVDLISSTGSSWTNLGTGLEATLTTGSTVPEPATLPIVSLGFSALLGLACRRRAGAKLRSSDGIR